MREAVNRRGQRATFLTAAARALAAGLEGGGVAQSAAELGVEGIAEWCVVDLVAEGATAEEGRTERAGAAHADAAKADALWTLGRDYPPASAQRVLKSGETEYIQEVPHRLRRLLAHDEQHERLLEQAGLSSYIAVPLTARGRLFGVMTFVNGPQRPQLTEADVSLAEEFAAGAALAIENARLYELADRQRSEAEQNRRRLELLLESTGEGIYGIDPEGRCTFINGSAAAMLGYSQAELAGRNMHTAIHHTRPGGEPYPEEECPIYAACRDGLGCRVDDELLFRADGSSFAADYSSYPIREDGRVTGAVITFNDISHRKRTEDALREAEQRYRELFEHVSEGVYQTSPDGELLAANRALIEMLGFESENDVRAQDVNALYEDPRDRERLTKQLERDGKLSGVELRLRHRDGHIIRVLENARAIRDRRRQVIYYEGTLRRLRDEGAG